MIIIISRAHAMKLNTVHIYQVWMDLEIEQATQADWIRA